MSLVLMANMSLLNKTSKYRHCCTLILRLLRSQFWLRVCVVWQEQRWRFGPTAAGGTSDISPSHTHTHTHWGSLSLQELSSDVSLHVCVDVTALDTAVSSVKVTETHCWVRTGLSVRATQYYRDFSQTRQGQVQDEQSGWWSDRSGRNFDPNMSPFYTQTLSHVSSCSFQHICCCPTVCEELLPEESKVFLSATSSTLTCGRTQCSQHHPQ